MSKLFDDASLAMIPSAYKDGKLYSIRPTDGSGDFTFSRGSNLAATRVDVNGLIEKGRENLVLQSNQFDTTWAVSTASISVTGGQSGYDGSSDAWLLKRNDASSRFIFQNLSANSSVYTLSFYGKPESEDWAYLYSFNGSAAITAYFDLQNGVVGTTSGSVISTNIEAAGNGYYRCSLTYNASVSQVRIYPAVGDDSVTGGVADAGIYIQDAQLEQGLVATDYIETGTSAAQSGILEDMPRLDYSGGASCPSLLLEPQRSNLFTQSEYYGSGGWSINSGTLTTNYAVSPEGLQNASKINFSAGGEIVRTTTFTAGQAYTFSFYAKVESGTFDFTYGNIDYSLISGTATTEWQRFEVTQTAPVVTRFPKIDATDTGDLLIWGCQIEQGSYPTSYIPTYGTSQTRSVEQLYTLEDSSLFDLEQGTFFLEMSALEDDGTDRKISISDGTNDNMVNIGFSRFTGNINGEVISNGVLQTSGFAAIGVTQTNNNKFALVWGNGEHRFYVNGVKTKESSISNSPVGMDILRFAQGNGSQRTFLNNKQLLVFPTALTDSECIALTTI